MRASAKRASTKRMGTGEPMSLLRRRRATNHPQRRRSAIGRKLSGKREEARGASADFFD
jgi:hypothetical protein